MKLNIKNTIIGILLFSTLIFIESCAVNRKFSIFESENIPADEIEEYVAYQFKQLKKASVKLNGKKYTNLSFDYDDDNILIQFKGGIVFVGFNIDEEIPNGELIVFTGDKLTIENMDNHKIYDTHKGSGLHVVNKDNNYKVYGVLNDSTETSKINVNVEFSEECIGFGTTKIEIKGNEAIITGILGSVSYHQIKQLEKEHSEVNTLILQNVPGSLNDGVNMHTGRLVKKAGYKVVVPKDGMIASGGVDLFCAGTERLVYEGAKVGIHSWCCYEGKTARELPQEHPAHNAQIDYFTEVMGERGREFYFHTLEAAPFDGIHWMTTNELKSWGFITTE